MVKYKKWLLVFIIVHIPMLVQMIVLKLMLPNSEHPQTPDIADLIFYCGLLVLNLIVLSFVFNVKKSIGNFVFVVPIVLFVFVFLSMSNDRIIGDEALVFFVLPLPLFLSTLIYSVAFLIYDKMHKHEQIKN